MSEKARAVVVLHEYDLDELERLAKAATQEEWKLGHTETQTVDDAVQWMTDAIRRRTDPDLWLVFIGDPTAEDGVITPAYTGNGPTSMANADYLVSVQPSRIRTLIMFLRHMLGDQEQIAIPLPEDWQ